MRPFVLILATLDPSVRIVVIGGTAALPSGAVGLARPFELEQLDQAVRGKKAWSGIGPDGAQADR